MIKLNSLPPINRSSKSRVGRGIAAGQGKTAGRGTKGQKSRTGYKLPRRFEGGQIALIQRLPKKRGFKHLGGKVQAVSYALLAKVFPANATISPETLLEKGIIKSLPKFGVKIIGIGDNPMKYQFSDLQLAKKYSPKTPQTPAKAE